MFWLNGEPADSVSLMDRSFQYGDGCFTTMLTRKGQIQYWSKHIERMNACLDALYIPRPDWNQVEQWLALAAKEDDKAGLKLHISRGQGGRGYSPTQVGTPNVTISAFPFPSHYEKWTETGIELGIAKTRLGHNPLLAGHKHNNRLEQVLVKAEMDQQTLLDGIVLDIADRVIETSMANLFWVKNDRIYTPDLSFAGVNGVMRRVVLQQAQDSGFECEIGHFHLDQVLSADEIFISNSVLGVAPIHTVSSTPFNIGKITKRIQEMIDS